MTGPWHNPERQSTGFETATVSTTAVAISPQGVAAELTLEDGAIRFRTDGVSPTSTVGHLLSVGQSLYLDNPSELSNLRMIRDGSTDGVVSVSYFNR